MQAALVSSPSGCVAIVGQMPRLRLLARLYLVVGLASRRCV